jgi:hypothetical protein
VDDVGPDATTLITPATTVACSYKFRHGSYDGAQIKPTSINFLKLVLPPEELGQRYVCSRSSGSTVAQEMAASDIVLMAHQVCRPYIEKENKDGSTYRADAPFPIHMAVMYLGNKGHWHLPPLNGISSAPCCMTTVQLGAPLATILRQGCGVRIFRT